MVLVSDKHVWHTGFVLWTLLLCLICRFVGTSKVLLFMKNIYFMFRTHLSQECLCSPHWTTCSACVKSACRSNLSWHTEGCEARWDFLWSWCWTGPSSHRGSSSSRPHLSWFCSPSSYRWAMQLAWRSCQAGCSRLLSGVFLVKRRCSRYCFVNLFFSGRYN